MTETVAGGKGDRAAVHREHAGVALGSGEDQVAAARLDHAAADGRGGAAEGRRVSGVLIVGTDDEGVGPDVDGVGAFQTAEVVGGDACQIKGGGLRTGGTGVEGAVLQSVDVGDGEGARRNDRVPAVRARAVQGEGADALLGEAPGPAEGSGESGAAVVRAGEEVLRPEHDGRPREAAERADRLAGGADGGDVEDDRVRGKIHVCPRGQCARAGEGEGAAPEFRGPGVAIGTRQDDVPGASGGESGSGAVVGDDRIDHEGVTGVVLEDQLSAGTVGGEESITRRHADGQGLLTGADQDAANSQGPRSSVHGGGCAGALEEGVHRGRGDSEGDVSTGSGGVEAEVGGGTVGEDAAGGGDVSITRVGGDGGVRCAAVHARGEIRAADGRPGSKDAVGVVCVRGGQTGRAKIQEAAGVAGDGIEGQGAGAAGADNGDRSVDRGGCHHFGVAPGRRAGAVELKGAAGEDKGSGIGQFGRVGGRVIEHQGAAAQGGCAGVGVGATQGESAGTHLHESSTGAAKDTGEAGALVVGSHADGVGADGEVVRAFESAEMVGVRSGDGEGDRLRAGCAGVQSAVEDGVDVAEREDAAGDGGVAGIGVQLAEGLGGGAGLHHGDGPGTVENQAVEDPGVCAADSQGAGGASCRIRHAARQGRQNSA